MRDTKLQHTAPDRRRFLGVCASIGVSASLFPDLLWSQLRREGNRITRNMIEDAATLAGVTIAESDKDLMMNALMDQVAGFAKIHAVKLSNDVAPVLVFEIPRPQAPRGGLKAEGIARIVPVQAGAFGAVEELAFASVRELGSLLRNRKVSSLALTEMYLGRLKRTDSQLHCVITLTEDRARAQALEADRNIGAGKYLGPLHGIPWGAKDLLSVKGYPTTWGSHEFRDQQFDRDATVVERLDIAGAVLVAKLSLGTLAMGGDEWFGGLTRNPWKLDEGAAGSSAGPASAVAAGCVAFAIGSETLDSISAPCARCGATGLRPTFGRVPRTGAMALCWSMDKLGPIARTADDCGVVLAALRGADAQDESSRDADFNWPLNRDVRRLRVGYLDREFAGNRAGISGEEEAEPRLSESRRIDAAALDTIRKLGLKLVAISLPDFPWRAMLSIPKAEAAAAFDELTRTGHDHLLPRQQKNWPNVFRVAHFIPAVEYINANRARRLALAAMERLFADCDVIVAPTSSVQLIATNLTGHPAVIIPNGFRSDGTPTSITFLGPLWGESSILALADAFQRSTNWHNRHPLWLEPRSFGAGSGQKEP